MSEGSSPDVTVDTKVHVGVVSESKGCRSWLSSDISVRGAIVGLISWISLPEGELRVGRDGGGGGVKLTTDLHEDVARTVESPPLLRSEGLPLGSPRGRYLRRDHAGWLGRGTYRRFPVAAGGREWSTPWRGCPCK